MKLSNLAESLWGQKARSHTLIIAALILLLSFLGARELWTQEHRWADIVAGMFYRNDFFHPYLGEAFYYDKPLLSYWLIALIAKVSGALTIWALRLPSVGAGCLALYAIYQLGHTLKNRTLGLLAAWLLLTTFYFLFWARTSSADMLNMAGSLCAVAWYISHRNQVSGFHYAVFFLIIALTSLCKGLVGAIVPLIAVGIDVLLQKSWKQHINKMILLAMLPAAVIYVLPFLGSSLFGGEQYGENGLYLVYRENILRYFQPFDHRGPIYTYFLYLPLYLFPWAIFFIPALVSLPRRWQSLSLNSKWLVYTVAALFIFFTISGSRRSYYILPVVPFAILLTADWILAKPITALRQRTAALVALMTFLLFLVALDIGPYWYYRHYGITNFSMALTQTAQKIQPWQQWNVIMLDGESKLNFYLKLPPHVKNYGLKDEITAPFTSVKMLSAWPILAQLPANTIVITRKAYLDALRPYFVGYRPFEVPTPPSHLPFLKNSQANIPIAFIPEPKPQEVQRKDLRG